MKLNLEQSNFAAIPSQAERLAERHAARAPIEVYCHELSLEALPGVYRTSVDTELMMDIVSISSDQTFLEIGCGTGAISIYLSKFAESGLGVDINTNAVENSRLNAEKYGVKNVEFLESDLFEKVSGTFDVIICNPPYSNHAAKDNIDKMFWDVNNMMKQRFFAQVGRYLKSGGRVYFGWANFADLSLDLPFRLAEQNGFEMVNEVAVRSSRSKLCLFYVFEFSRKCSE